MKLVGHSKKTAPYLNTTRARRSKGYRAGEVNRAWYISMIPKGRRLFDVLHDFYAAVFDFHFCTVFYFDFSALRFNHTHVAAALNGYR